jgi:DNA invertase Pin-like site-specific DNA recombinase
MASDQSARPIDAAQYLRMSTERQDYSIEFQTAANAAYALEHGYRMVATYADKGISGLGIANREGLKQLLADVVGGNAKFTLVLVYDVSRWGRFQDPDQAGHYEFICREAGVKVEYSAEAFPNDGSMANTLLKSLKRMMAAEYSRELSSKVTRTKHGLRELGYWQGGAPGYGLRRQIVTRAGKVVRVCEYGETNAHKNGRTVIILGPPDEIAVVRRIYRLFLAQGLQFTEIARELNREGIEAEGGIEWRWWHVRQILTNEKYAGTFVLGQQLQRLGQRENVPRAEWRRMPGRIVPIVPPATFKAAAAELARRRRPPLNEELIAELRRLLATHGFLSGTLIDTYSVHSSDYYRRRFGELLDLFRKIGFEPTTQQLRMREVARKYAAVGRPHHEIWSDEALLEKVRGLLAREGALSGPIITKTPGMPAPATLRRRFGSFKYLYALVGYVPTTRQREQMETLRRPAGLRLT